MASKIDNNNYIHISGWMVNELGLKGNELMVFALIYGFSQDGESEFRGSLNYICNWLNCSRHTVIDALKSLIEKEYVSKTEMTLNGVKFCSYSINALVVQKLHWGSAEIALGGSAEIAPNNTNNINTNKNTRFIKPTLEELNAYISEKNLSVDAQRFLDYYDSNGWMVGKNHMKDWKATIRGWESREKKSKPAAKMQEHNFDYSAFEDMAREVTFNDIR